MKAIQIKYLGPTYTKGARLKAFTEAKSIVASREFDLNVDVQALKLAKEYIHEMAWNAEITGFGCLPNGDYVATIGFKAA